MKNSNLELMQSAFERQNQINQLIVSLQLLSQTLINFEKLIEQSELPIMNSTTLLNGIESTTRSIESNLSSILTEVGNLSPQVLQEATMDYLVALKAIHEQISNTDISKLQRLSVSIESLQTEINKAIGSISIDQKSIQAQVQAQVKQAIEESQSELIETGIQSLLNSQKAKYMTWASTVFGGLMILISFYTIYQFSTNLKTIQAQKEMIQQNSQTIQSQLNYLNSIRR
ncbi:MULTISPECIES: hypothetical protein [Acinetobacter]|jgi:hypothetical protein|uniref:Uncharacterized protein n=2 Tax=Acinetobacter TaxID=469 RepID=A0A7T8ASB0_9GAMM|nr:MULTISPECIES: hypothetical protein [Acinetobacter]MDM1337085.1 hypothetical protein [Acinetobacter pseudolwoffii]MDM1765906.1 hypothetical protein [Acinetobacter sp. 226-1]MDM1769654.1 hypothetical protein [Acinetobacter sp. 226-4]PJI28712.1 hypothetical protein CU478_13060 [Acinetobacter pseudolwoffii]QOW48214.1 hypothetical protein G0028_20455 [Acinetobacter piscicola]